MKDTDTFTKCFFGKMADEVVAEPASLFTVSAEMCHAKHEKCLSIMPAERCNPSYA